MEEPPPDDPWLRRSLDAVDAHLDALGRDGFPPERVVLLGFSQGACVLAHFALQHPRRFAGLVALTGGWIGAAGGRSRSSPATSVARPRCSRPREADDWVPLSRVRDTERAPPRARRGVTALVEPPGEHAVSDTAALLLARFLAELTAQRIEPTATSAGRPRGGGCAPPSRRRAAPS